jgi:hypothetical protein
MKRTSEGLIVSASANDPLFLVGGKDDGGNDYFYEARCLRDWKLADEKPLKYNFQRFEG